MTNEVELNEKVLKFAGLFKPRDVLKYVAPDFLHDLQACVDWLGPKFEGIEIRKALSFKKTSLWIAGVSNEFNTFYSEFQDTPAMAFCRAVEKSIEPDIDIIQK